MKGAVAAMLLAAAELRAGLPRGRLSVVLCADEEHGATYGAIATASALGIPHVTPAGAFYLWLPLGKLMDDPADTMAFCVDLIDRQRVALAPGETFGLGRLADHVGTAAG